VSFGNGEETQSNFFLGSHFFISRTISLLDRGASQQKEKKDMDNGVVRLEQIFVD
jgi:hypothetical protein